MRMEADTSRSFLSLAFPSLPIQSILHSILFYSLPFHSIPLGPVIPRKHLFYGDLVPSVRSHWGSHSGVGAGVRKCEWVSLSEWVWVRPSCVIIIKPMGSRSSRRFLALCPRESIPSPPPPPPNSSFLLPFRRWVRDEHRNFVCGRNYFFHPNFKVILLLRKELVLRHGTFKKLVKHAYLCVCVWMTMIPIFQLFCFIIFYNILYFFWGCL